MAVRFRKSKKVGPFRFTASKSGLSVSAGVKGFRVTKTARGGVRTTASIPGTGLSYVQESGGRSEGKRVKKTVKRKKSRKWIWIAVAALLVIGAFGSKGRTGGTEPSPTPTAEILRAMAAPTVEPTIEPTSTPAPTPRPTVEPTPTPVHSYVLNQNSHVFHYEWCSSVSKMSEKNRLPFEGTRDEVISQGYEPCSICKP